MPCVVAAKCVKEPLSRLLVAQLERSGASHNSHIMQCVQTSVFCILSYTSDVMEKNVYGTLEHLNIMEIVKINHEN